MKRGKKFTSKYFKKLFESLHPQLCVFANRYLNDIDISKDVVQEVFIKVWEDKPIFENENHATGYFYKSVKNKCLNYLKSALFKDSKRSERIIHEIYLTEEFFMAEAVIIETTVIIKKAVDALPEKAQRVIQLSMENYTNQQIAEDLKISINTVKDHKKVAYIKLRQHLSYLEIV
ncbi:MAG: RNA polymerase sigma-70 factor [Cellulophaga sp.]